jgi:hypothetical protein
MNLHMNLQHIVSLDRSLKVTKTKGALAALSIYNTHLSYHLSTEAPKSTRQSWKVIEDLPYHLLAAALLLLLLPLLHTRKRPGERDPERRIRPFAPRLLHTRDLLLRWRLELSPLARRRPAPGACGGGGSARVTRRLPRSSRARAAKGCTEGVAQQRRHGR